MKKLVGVAIAILVALWFYITYINMPYMAQFNPKLKEIKRVAGRVAESHEYEEGVYDCDDFSKKLRREIIDLEYNYTRVNVLATEVNCIYWDSCKGTSMHSFVVVEDFIRGKKDLYIEATSGEIIQPYEYPKYGLDLWKVL